MRTNLLRIVFCGLTALLCSKFSLAQSPFQKIRKADSLYSADSLMAALTLYSEAVQELKAQESVNFERLAYATIKTADVYAEIIGAYDSLALNAYLLAYEFYGKTSFKQKKRQVIPKMVLAHRSIRENSLPVRKKKFDDYQTEDLTFKITAVGETKNGLVAARIEGGEYDGIFKASRGWVRGSWKFGSVIDRSDIRLGQATIQELDMNGAIIIIELNHPDKPDSTYGVHEGDMVFLSARIPKKDYSSIFWELMLNNIAFKDKDGNYLYDLRLLINMDSRELEQDLLELMRDDMVATYDAIKHLADDNPGWKEKLTEGRFAGMSMLDALKGCAEKDVLNFLRYALSKSTSYQGKDYNLNETFATWIINGTPIGSDEFNEMLVNAKSAADIKKIYDEYNKQVNSGDYLTYANIAAEEWNKKYNLDTAMKLLKAAEQYCIVANDDNSRAWAIFTMANVNDDYDSKFKDAESYFLQALPLFEKTKDNSGIAFTANNLGSLYYGKKLYQQSIAQYDIAIEAKNRLLAQDSTASKHISLAKSLYGAGLNHMKISNFNEALDYYYKAAYHYEKANNLAGTKGAADTYGEIAKALKNKGDYKEAVIIYRQLIKTYELLGNNAKIADHYDNLAWCLFELADYRKAISAYDSAAMIKLALGEVSDAGFSFSNVGQAYWNLGLYDSAIIAHSKAIEYRLAGGDSSGVAFSYSKLGGLYKESGEASKAIEYYDKATAIYQALGKEESMAELKVKVGDFYYSLKDYNRAIEAYEFAKNYYISNQSQIDFASTLSSIGDAYYAGLKFDKALAAYDSCLKIQLRIGDKSGAVYTLTNLGLVTETHLKDYKKSEEYFNKALAFADSTGSDYYRVYSYRQLGRQQQNRGYLKKSLEYYRKAEAIVGMIDNKTEEVEVALGIGNYFFNSGKFHDAESYFLKAQTIAEAANNQRLVASAISSLGYLYRIMGEFRRSEEMHLKSLALYKSIDNQWGVSDAYLGLGNVYNSFSDYAKAIDYYKKSDSLMQVIGWEGGRSSPLNNTGTIYYWMGDYARSLDYFTQTLDVEGRNNPEGTFINLIEMNVGRLYFEQKKYDSARHWLFFALGRASKKEEQRNISYAYNNLSMLTYAQGKYDSAAYYARKSLEIQTDTGEASFVIEAKLVLGQVELQRKNYAEAEALMGQVEALCRKTGLRKYLWESLYYKSLAAKAQGKNQEAFTELQESVGIVEELGNSIVGGAEARKLFSGGEKQIKLYEQLIQWLLDDGRAEEALAYLNRGNNEILNAKFKGAAGGGSNNEILKAKEEKQRAAELADKELAEQLSKPQNEQKPDLIAKLQEIRTVTQQEYQNFLSRTIKEQPGLKAYITGINPRDFPRVRDSMPDDLAAVYYLIGAKSTYIFVATKDSVFAKVVNKPQEEIDGKVKAFYEIMKAPGFKTGFQRGTKMLEVDENSKEKDFLTLSRDLYDLLILPISMELQGKKRITFIPNGSLFFLPFQALASSYESNKVTYLADNFSINYSNILEFRKTAGISAATNLMPLAIGNADASLPNAEREVIEIQKMYPKGKVLIGKNATKASFLDLIAEHNVMHLATHGILNFNDFDSSYIMLAGDPKSGDDGKFTIMEINNLTGKINNYQIVTLSACETAVTEDIVEGWPQSPALAFLAVGAQTVIATLWQVDDKATGRLMEQFYANLKTMDKMEALHQAQISMSKMPEYSHPYYWAPFVYYGK